MLQEMGSPNCPSANIQYLFYVYFLNIQTIAFSFQKRVNVDFSSFFESCKAQFHMITIQHRLDTFTIHLLLLFTSHTMWALVIKIFTHYTLGTPCKDQPSLPNRYQVYSDTICKIPRKCKPLLYTPQTIQLDSIFKQ